MPPSSSGPGRHSFKVEITSSNLVGGTKSILTSPGTRTASWPVIKGLMLKRMRSPRYVQFTSRRGNTVLDHLGHYILDWCYEPRLALHRYH